MVGAVVPAPRTESPVEDATSTAGARSCRGQSRKRLKSQAFLLETVGTSLASAPVRSIVTIGRKVQVNRIRTATVAVLLASFAGFQPAPAMAQGKDRRDRY